MSRSIGWLPDDAMRVLVAALPEHVKQCDACRDFMSVPTYRVAKLESIRRSAESIARLTTALMPGGLRHVEGTPSDVMGVLKLMQMVTDGLINTAEAELDFARTDQARKCVVRCYQQQRKKQPADEPVITQED